MYLKESNAGAAFDFISGPIWADIKRCLALRAPALPDRGDKLRAMAAAGFERKGYESCIAEIEKLVSDTPEAPTDPFDRPAMNPAD